MSDSSSTLPDLSQLKYDEKGLITCVVQDVVDGQVLMVAYMNEESLKRTLTEGLTCFWSRSRQEYWVKGLTSGNTQKVIKVTVDCDKDCLLVVVEQQGTKVACHTGARSCFFRELKAGESEPLEIDTDHPIYKLD